MNSILMKSFQGKMHVSALIASIASPFVNGSARACTTIGVRFVTTAEQRIRLGDYFFFFFRFGHYLDIFRVNQDVLLTVDRMYLLHVQRTTTIVSVNVSHNITSSVRFKGFDRPSLRRVSFVMLWMLQKQTSRKRRSHVVVKRQRRVFVDCCLHRKPSRRYNGGC